MGGLIQEDVPARGDLYRHQKLFQRFLRQYDKCLNIQETGTGKTCALVGLAEYFRNNQGTIRKVYVLERGPSTINEFTNQITNACTAPGTWSVPDLAMDEISQRRQINSQIRRWYSVMSYHNFATSVREMSDERIVDEYSGCIFLVDEAHNIHPNTNAGFGKDSNALKTGDIYQILWRVFHLVKRSKIILATATPMINGPEEIAAMMNLILPTDFQMPLNWKYERVTFSQMEPFFRGRVSFVRALDTGARPVYQENHDSILGRFGKYHVEVPPSDEVRNADGEVIPGAENPRAQLPCQPTAASIINGVLVTDPQPQPEVPMLDREIQSQIVTYNLPMSGRQQEVYLSVITDETRANRNFYDEERQAALFVFPDGTFGGKRFKDGAVNIATKGLSTYITSTVVSKVTMTDEFRRALQRPADLQQMSCKYAKILEVERASHRTGCAFIFIEKIGGGGVMALSAVLEANGFTQFNAKTSVFENGSDRGRPKGDFRPQRRYGILSGETEINHDAALLELFNSKANMHGDYVQIIIGSRTARDGINLFNVTRMWHVESGWHQSGMHQATSRVLRANAYVNLLADKRAQYVREGRDPATATIEVKIYHLAAYAEEYYEESGETRYYSIDQDMYQSSEKKEVPIRRIIRYLKRAAIDCLPHYNRNVREADVDFTATCDYDYCNYTCACARVPRVDEGMAQGQGPTLTEMDYSTYDILYSDEVVSACITAIRNKMRSVSRVTIQELYQLWDPSPPEESLYRRRFILMAINRIIQEKIALINRYGFTCYLGTDGISIFTQTDFPIGPSRNYTNLSIYSQELPGIEAAPFLEISEEMQRPIQTSIFMDMLAIPDPLSDTGMEQVIKMLHLLTLHNRIRHLEDAIVASIQDPDGISPLYEAIMDIYRDNIFHFNEPRESISRIAEVQSMQRSRVKMEDIPIEVPDDGDDVWTHNIMNTETGPNAYGATSQFHKSDKGLRILKPSEGMVWRNADDSEQQAYSTLISNIINESMQRFQTDKVYGTILEDRQFRLVYPTRGSKVKSGKADDKRSKNKGIVCGTIPLPKLVRTAHAEGLVSPAQLAPAIMEATRENIIEYLLVKNFDDRARIEAMPTEELRSYYQWFQYNREDICKILQRHLESEGRLAITSSVATRSRR